MANYEADSLKTTKDSKDTDGSTHCIQVAPQKLSVNLLEEIQRKPTANGTAKNFTPGKDKLTSVNILLLSEPSLTGQKVADCILFSNKLTETPSRSNGFHSEHLTLMNTHHTGESLHPPPASARPTSCPLLTSRGHFGFLVLPNFLVLSLSILFMAYGCSAVAVHFIPYALNVGLGHQQAAFLMSIFGVSSIVGNITFGWIMDRK